MQCLNPIICNIKFNPLDGKAQLFNFRNLREECKKYGDDKLLREIDNGIYSTRRVNGFLQLYHEYDSILLPCRKCVNCQLNRSREWAIRNTLESRSYDEESKLFITLTYNDDALKSISRRWQCITRTGKKVDVPMLSVVDVQKFLKRLRKYFSAYKIRFYLCGEYGGQTYRPHYHILLYGLPLSAIDDLDLLYETENGKFYNSKIVENLWSLGFINISTFSEYTAMYVSRYCTKKQDFNYSLNYCFKNKELKREFNTMSRRPGIAADYIITHSDDIYKHDEFLFHIDGKSFALKPLKFFDRHFDFENPDQFKFIKENRKAFAQAHNYFENLENNYGIAEYLNNIERISLSKIHSRKGVC